MLAVTLVPSTTAHTGPLWWVHICRYTGGCIAKLEQLLFFHLQCRWLACKETLCNDRCSSVVNICVATYTYVCSYNIVKTLDNWKGTKAISLTNGLSAHPLICWFILDTVISSTDTHQLIHTGGEDVHEGVLPYWFPGGETLQRRGVHTRMAVSVQIFGILSWTTCQHLWCYSGSLLIYDLWIKCRV